MRGKNVEIDIDFNLLDRFWLEAKGFSECKKNKCENWRSGKIERI